MQLGVIIVAAGSSKRMGFDKLMHPLCDKPVLQHTLDAFQHHQATSEVVLVTPKERFEQLSTLELVSRVEGGSERHFSVLKGLESLCNKITHVAVHDGARPLISAEQITATTQAAIEYQSATSAKRITDTVKRSDSEDFAASAVSRENLWAMETPQTFELQLLLKAYRKVIDEDLIVTDEVSAVEHLGVKTKLIQNPTPNPKITFPEDVALAERLYLSKDSSPS